MTGCVHHQTIRCSRCLERDRNLQNAHAKDEAREEALDKALVGVPTLRQRYAMAALTGLLMDGKWSPSVAAVRAFEYADAMLAAEKANG